MLENILEENKKNILEERHWITPKALYIQFKEGIMLPSYDGKEVWWRGLGESGSIREKVNYDNSSKYMMIKEIYTQYKTGVLKIKTYDYNDKTLVLTVPFHNIKALNIVLDKYDKNKVEEENLK